MSLCEEYKSPERDSKGYEVSLNKKTGIPKQNPLQLLQMQDRAKWGSPKRMSERDHSLKLPAPGEFLQSSNIGTDDPNSRTCYRSLIGSSSSTFSGCCGRGQVPTKSQRKRKEENKNWRKPKNFRNRSWEVPPRTRSRLRLLLWARTNPDQRHDLVKAKCRDMVDK